MTSTAKLLAEWMKARGLTTQTAAAKALGTKPSTVNNWLQGVSQAAPSYITQMAFDLGQDGAGWVLLIESERARDAKDRKALAALAKQLGMAASVALCAIGGVIPLISQAANLPALHLMLRRGVIRTWYRERFGTLLARPLTH